MSVIRILSAEMAGRIAAGEVIERPASVVKELVENSIDAGATRIRVQIEQGGQRLIQVTDNGCGMDREDALMCLEAHATSKLSKDGDVGQIATLGFRGEAIPSIASVSHFQLQTRRHDADVGTEVVVDNGIVRDVADCGCAPGTNIRVAHLFGNLPARRKFLRGADTEDGHIEEMMLMLALARPDIAFTLTLNNREVIRATATGDIAARVVMLLGRDAFAAMLPVDYEEDGIRVRGFVSRPGYTRSSRREQRMIINGRAAAAETLYFAIREAYDTLILKGRYPGAVLYLDLAPERVDVNVHPAKREVRFREPRQVGLVVAAAIRRALRQMPGGSGLDETPMPMPEATPRAFVAAPQQRELPSFADDGGHQPSATAVAATPPAAPPPVNTAPPDTPPAAAGDDGLRLIPAAPPPVNTDTPPAAAGDDGLRLIPAAPPPANTVPAAPPAPAFAPRQPGLPNLPLAPPSEQPARPSGAGAVATPAEPPPAVAKKMVPRPAAKRSAGLSLQIRGRLGARYILAESPAGLVVVDIRAAHQRLLFERLLANLNGRQNVMRQQLLLPVTVNLSVVEARLLQSQLTAFDDLGFTVEAFGGTTFLITAVPASFPDQDLARAFQDILEDLRQHQTGRSPNAIHLAQMACRHAVTVRDTLSDADIKVILDGLAEADMPYTDPVGKPTMIHLTYAELEKRFNA